MNKATHPFKVSIVICTYNRDKFIGEALDSLANQTLNAENFEILIVNNNSNDTTETICKKFINDHPELDVNYVMERQQGLSYARNRGIEDAKYDIITYIDDDAYAKPDFVEIVYNYFNKHPETAGIGGKIKPRYEIEEPEWMNPYLYGVVSAVDHGDKVLKFNKRYPVGCNMSYRKDILKSVGGFNTNLKWRSDDKFIYLSVRKISDEVYYIPELEVEHTIDAYRTTDKCFEDITTKFGKAEYTRVKDEGSWTYFKKLVEFFYKLAGSFILMIGFMLKGQPKKGRYTFRYRWIATKAFLNIGSNQ
ncbi:MAG: glycosyltransferase [bacterium]|nr:glycosyltransferase [bacterium]